MSKFILSSLALAFVLPFAAAQSAPRTSAKAATKCCCCTTACKPAPAGVRAHAKPAAGQAKCCAVKATSGSRAMSMKDCCKNCGACPGCACCGTASKPHA